MAEAMSESLSGSPPAASSSDDATQTAEPVPELTPPLKSPTVRLALKLFAVFLLLLLLVLVLREPAPAGTTALAHPGLVPTPVPGLTCSNADIASGSQQWADTEPPPGWSVVYATVLQRHWDRWIYAHSLIHNRCWPGQLDSTVPPMPEQCGYDTDSVWEHFPPGEDPYSTPPSAGSCFCPQLTLQGREHAFLLGQTLRNQYGSLLQDAAAGVACRARSVGLETENAQKNEVSLQTAYHSLCDHLPDTVEYPKSSVVWEGGSPRRDTPFFLERRLCKGDGVLDQLEAMATTAKEASSYWDDAHTLALEVAQASGHPPPERADSATMLDNIEDCIVSHACHGLGDTPSAFLVSPTLFTDVDTLETTNRAWGLNYFLDLDGGGAGSPYENYHRRYYGYYFKVVLDRMDAARSAPTGTGTRLNLQVLSDSNITPLLTMLGAGELARRRPYWGSTLVFEMWQQERTTTNHAVRVIFNGHVLALQGACMGQNFCEWNAWQDLLLSLIPTRVQCPEFYDAY